MKSKTMKKGGAAKRKAEATPIATATATHRHRHKKQIREEKFDWIKEEKVDYEDEPRRGTMEDLWNSAFPHLPTEIKWDFSNLEQALFQEAGKLYPHIHNNNKKVYLFSTTENHMTFYVDEDENLATKYYSVPAVVAIVSASPPAHELGYTKADDDNMPGGRGVVRAIPMENMNMDWIPYMPSGDRAPQIFYLGCRQRRVASDYPNNHEFYDIFVPYVRNGLESSAEEEQHGDGDTDLLGPVKRFLLDELIQDDEFLSAENKSFLMRYVKMQLCEARRKAKRAEIARENMMIYKFYPRETPHTPPITYKLATINEYCRDADEVLS